MIGLGSDHLGFALKERLHILLCECGGPARDFGALAGERADYPDIAAAVAAAVREGLVERGILVCRTGLGMAIAANKVPGVFAAPVHDPDTARLARKRNHVQIITLGADLVSVDEAWDIVTAWLAAEFRGGESARKVDKIRALEKLYWRVGGTGFL